MGLRSRIALLALGALVAAPAQASDKQDFETCDGRVHPGKQDDGMRRTVSASPFAALIGDRAGVAAACTRALESPRLLSTQTLRRAHLLRARAAARLRAGESDKALEDLDLAEAATTSLATERFHQRSMAVSMTLLRAIARAQQGDMAAAVPLARAAMAARPYSLQVQQVAATVLQAARPAGAPSPSPWVPVSRLDPGFTTSALINEAEVGNFAGVLAARPAVQVTWPTERVTPLALATRDPGASQLFSAVMVSINTAYARAATGDPQGARRDLGDLRTRFAAAHPPADPDAAGLMATTFAALDKYVDMRSRQVEARIAVAEAHPADAIAVLVAAPMPRDAATVDLLKALKAAVAEKDAGLVPTADSFEADLRKSRLESLSAAVSLALIAPETPRAVIDYQRARPNILGALIGGALSMGTSLLGGIDRTDGFRTTANPDGSTKVEFVGNTPSAPLVQEMTLLRAAEVARAAGKPAFVIVERKDFARRLTTTQYGREISSVPTGFKTELTIRYLDAGAEPERALDVVAIIDALGPLYYEERQVAKRS